MAIYSCNHKPVGRTTHAPGTAGAAVRYITRTAAATLVMGEHMPTDRDAARAWIDRQEVEGRKNARVCDKLLVALPIELDAAQRAELVREFVHEIGGGRISWLAAVHDRGRDAHNPHAHIIIRDKDQDTGKRVYGTSEKGSTERLRELWQDMANRALERVGSDARIDCRSLAEQGIAREAGIHVGPNVVAMEERGLRPVSLAQEVERPGKEPRVVNWPEIDQGRTRADRQREIEGLNSEREREKERGKDEQPQLKPRQEAHREAKPAQQGDTKAKEQEATQQPENSPSPPIPEPEATRPRDPIEERATWAARLRALAQSPETPHPSLETERTNRFREILETARIRLSALGDRLETAFQALKDRRQSEQRYFLRMQAPTERSWRSERNGVDGLSENQRVRARAAYDKWVKNRINPISFEKFVKSAQERDAEKETERGYRNGPRLMPKIVKVPLRQASPEKDDDHSVWPDYRRGRDMKGPGF